MGKIIRKCIEYGGSSNSAENIKYDDTKNMKEAINEVKSEIGNLLGNTDISAIGDSTVTGAISTLNSNLTDLITGTITSGGISITLTDSRIKSNSIIDIYFENKVLAPTNVTVTDGSITIEIESQDSDTNVGVRCL